MSRLNRTDNPSCQASGRRALPAGWRIIDGMGSAATCIDPTIEQTRDIAHVLFAATLAGRNIGFRRYPADALQAWTAHALRRGDAGLAAILEQLDAETFAATWCVLVRRFDRAGAVDTLEWLQRRIAGRV